MTQTTNKGQESKKPTQHQSPQQKGGLVPTMFAIELDTQVIQTVRF